MVANRMSVVLSVREEWDRELEEGGIVSGNICEKIMDPDREESGIVSGD